MSGYELLKKLAEGGMGEVFIARRKGVGNFDKRVALKLMLPHQAKSKDKRDRFLAEARLAALMHHPNVVEIFDVGEQEGRPFLAMQLVEGVTLATFIRETYRKGQDVPLPLARLIALGLCEGLTHVHGLRDRKGKPLELVHRDVTPSNVLVSKEGAVLVTDFGIARARDAEGHTQPGQVRGKPAWLSPEQLGGLRIDQRADQYSTALVLYELCTGEQPFRGPDRESSKARDRQVVPAVRLRPELGARASAALERALSLDPARRFESMRAFGEAFVDGPIATAPELGAWVRERFQQRLEELGPADEGSETPSLSPTSASRGALRPSGLVFGRYEVKTKLATGGMGEVYLARQGGLPGFERDVILKSLLPERAGDARAIEEFLDEARVLATLNHPNLVSLYDVGTWEGSHFIAMELIRGKNLRELLRDATRDGNLVPTHVAATIVRDAALGLAHAHAASDPRGKHLQIVHRDVSPQNIMVRFDGLTKIVDFGIATSVTRQADATAPGWVKGKLAYLSPEQVLGHELTPLVDQYALGICLWELLVGKRLFGATAENRLQPVASPSTVRKDVPEALGAIAVRMLQPDPSARFPSCDAVAAALDEWLRSQHVETRNAVVDFMAPWAEESRSEQAEMPERPPASDAETPPPEPRPSAPQPSLRSEPTRASRPRDVRAQTVSLERPAPRRSGLVVAAVGLVAVASLCVWWFSRTGAEVTGPRAVDASERAASPNAAVDDARGSESDATPDATDDTRGSKSAATPDAPDDTRGGETGATPNAAVLGAIEAPASLDAGARPTRPGRPPRLPATPSGPGALSVNTRPWTRVLVDGASWGSTPIIERALPPGAHVIELINEGAGIHARREVTVTSAETTKLNLTLSP